MFVSEFHYASSSKSDSQLGWVEILVPATFDLDTLAVVTYSFDKDKGGTADGSPTYLGSLSGFSYDTVLPAPNAEWRVVVLTVPSLRDKKESDLDGIALVVFCEDGTRSVTDFVCYSGAGKEDKVTNTMAVNGLAQGASQAHRSVLGCGVRYAMLL